MTLYEGLGNSVSAYVIMASHHVKLKFILHVFVK